MEEANATSNVTICNTGMYKSKPAEVVLIAIVGSVVLIVVNAYMSIELTLISDKVIKSDLEDSESESGGSNGRRRPRVHMCAWPVLRMVICLVINVGGTVALTAIWMTHGACTDGLIVISDICFGTMALCCGIHIALGVCCPRKNCWPRFINASAAAAKGEEEEGDSPKVKSGSDEDIKDAIVAAAAAAGVSIEDQTETTEM